MTLIKQISTKRFEISLYEVNNAFIIKYTNVLLETSKQSEKILDYHVASYLFDLKISDMEGH